MTLTNQATKGKIVMSLMFALSLIVTSELSIQNGKVEEFLSIVTAGLEESRSFSGNQSFDIYVEKDTPGKVLFVERWESEEHFQKYYQWRLKQGDFQLLGTFFSAPPVMRQYIDTAE